MTPSTSPQSQTQTSEKRRDLARDSYASNGTTLKQHPDSDDGTLTAADPEKYGAGGDRKHGHGQMAPPDNGPERRSSVWDARGDPFGDEEGNEVKYRTMSWWQASMIMIAETISLGILSLPSVLASIGMAPGIILIAGLGLLATYTGYTIGQVKMAYPHVHNMADAGEVLFGSLGMPAVGRELFGAAQTIFLIFSMGSHVLTFTIAFNAITGHATCTIVWGIVGTALLWLFTIPRTLKKVSYLSVACKIPSPASLKKQTDQKLQPSYPSPRPS